MLEWCERILTNVSAGYLTGHRQGNKQKLQNISAKYKR